MMKGERRHGRRLTRLPAAIEQHAGIIPEQELRLPGIGRHPLSAQHERRIEQQRKGLSEIQGICLEFGDSRNESDGRCVTQHPDRTMKCRDNRA